MYATKLVVYPPTSARPVPSAGPMACPAARNSENVARRLLRDRVDSSPSAGRVATVCRLTQTARVPRPITAWLAMIAGRPNGRNSSPPPTAIVVPPATSRARTPHRSVSDPSGMASSVGSTANDARARLACCSEPPPAITYGPMSGRSMVCVDQYRTPRSASSTVDDRPVRAVRTGRSVVMRPARASTTSR